MTAIKGAKRIITVTCKKEKYETHDFKEAYIWTNWIEINPKDGKNVCIELKKGTEINIKCK